VDDFWTDRRILVTGGAGFLGSAVRAALEGRGARNVLAPSSTAYDLRDRGAVAALFAESDPELVLHLASRVGGIGANQARPAELYLDNLLMGTYIIDEALRNQTPKILVMGTVCSYPSETPIPFHESSLWDGYPEATNAPYGIAKRALLVHLQTNRAQHGQRSAFVMPTNLYGPGDKFHPAVSHVIPALIKKCIDAEESGADSIEVWGTGTATRDFLYVDDAAEGVLLVAEHYDDPAPVNLGAQAEVPISTLVGLIAELTGFAGEVRWDPTRPDGQLRRCLDTTTASALGFKATTPLEEGLRRTVDWYRANRSAAIAREI
jgi:GDP-L-fucose synthase